MVHCGATPGDSEQLGAIAVVALLALVICLLVVFVFRQGHWRTTRLIDDSPTEHGRTIIQSAIAEDALADAVANRPEFISASVSTFQVRKTPVLKVSVTARRGVSPKDVTATVESALTALDELLGETIPAFLHITGGFRAKVARPTRPQ